MAEHTPGPWEYREPGGEEVFGPAIYALGAHDTDPLAAAKTDADARLIAAAPDLLAALEELAHPSMDAHELAHLSDMQQGDIHTARAAIAKAKGEA